MTERLCSKCHSATATSNGYCANCNAKRMKSKRHNADDPPDTLSLAVSFGVQLDTGVAMFADSLTDAQALFLLERLYGHANAQRKVTLLIEEGRLEL